MKSKKKEYNFVKYSRWVLYPWLIVCLIISAASKDYQYFFGYTGLFIGIITLAYSIYIQLEKDVQSEEDKKVERKVEIISAETANDIKTKIQALYKGELQGKTIDKIEIVNTLTDHSNENRKDVIIIYH